MQVLKRKPMRVTDRAVNRPVTEEFLRRRVGDGRYGVSKWIQYCRVMLKAGYRVELYEAKETVSKYITVHGNFDLSYTVRFSDHPPSTARMIDSEVKMIVGASRNTLTDAIEATLQWFSDDRIYGSGTPGKEMVRQAENKAPQNERHRTEGVARQADLFASYPILD